MRKTPVVLGVLAMVFGGMVAAWEGFTLFLGSPERMQTVLHLPNQAPNDPAAAHLAAELHQAGVLLRPYTDAMRGGLLLLSVALLAIGWGLYQRQRWARPAAIGWAVVGLAYIGLELWVHLAIVQPRLEAVLSHAFSGKDPRMAALVESATKGAAVAFQLVFFAPFPVVLLALLGRRSARDDFAA